MYEKARPPEVERLHELPQISETKLQNAVDDMKRLRIYEKGVSTWLRVDYG